MSKTFVNSYKLLNCSLRFVTLDKNGKNGPKKIVTVKKACLEMFVSINLRSQIGMI